MRNEATFDDLNWYVIQTHSKQEDRAAENLAAWGLNVCNPKIKGHRRNSFTGELAYFARPLFPNYIFAKFSLNSVYHKLRFTRGVRSVLNFGDYATPVDEAIINIIQSRLGDDGFVTIGEKFIPGESVIIREGPRQHLVGIVEKEVQDSDRVMILLNAVNYQARIIVDRRQIDRVSEMACVTSA